MTILKLVIQHNFKAVFTGHVHRIAQLHQQAASCAPCDQCLLYLLHPRLVEPGFKLFIYLIFCLALTISSDHDSTFQYLWLTSFLNSLLFTSCEPISKGMCVSLVTQQHYNNSSIDFSLSSRPATPKRKQSKGKQYGTKWYSWYSLPCYNLLLHVFQREMILLPF